MRFVVRVSLPPEKFNQDVRDGTAGRKIGEILEELKPEAVYFTAENGRRGGILIVDLDDASEIPKYAEPWFLKYDATVEFLPTMSPADLEKAGLDDLGKKWG